MSNVHPIPSKPAGKTSTAKRMIFMVVGILLLVGVIVGVKVVLIKKQMAGFKPPAPPVVTTMAVQAAPWQNEVETVGSLRAWRGTDLATEVAGLVRRVVVKSGQGVGEGDVLFELNADAEKAQLRTLQAAADLAKIVLDRDRAQIDVHAVSQAAVDADEADLKSKQAQVVQQQALVDKKTVRAPFAGRVGITTIQPGSYVNSGDKLITLQAIDRLYVDFYVPQREIPRLGIGSNIWLQVDSFPGRRFQGRVNAINPTVDSSTRNVQVEAEIANPKHELLPGMFGHLGLAYGKPQDYLTIPQAAVAFNPYGASVFVIDPPDSKSPGADGKARQVFITPGPTRGDQIAIIAGLKAGDVVVTSGQLKLKTGAPVHVDNRVQPLNEANPTPQEQ
jgi:membrane fusion protein (multidrug efflux system)